MTVEVQNAIRFAMCHGWIKTLTNPKRMPALSSRYSDLRNGQRTGRVPNVTLDNCSIINCGTAFKVSGNSFIEMNQTYVSGCNTFAEVDGDARVDVHQSRIEDCVTLVKEAYT